MNILFQSLILAILTIFQPFNIATTKICIITSLIIISLTFYHFNFKKSIYILLLATLTQIPLTNLILRNIIFQSIFYSMILIYGLAGAAAILFAQYIYPFNIHILPQIFATHILFLCDNIVNLKIKIKGPIPHNAIIAPQHQSLLEIIALAQILPNAKFVFTHMFLYIPGFGYCMKKLDMIPVNRSANNPNWLAQAIKVLSQKNNLIIFPEGEIIPYNSIKEYKKGVFKLAIATHQNIIPVYIDAGLFWPKGICLIKPGTSIIKFGQSITPTAEHLRNALKSMQDEETANK